jgi:hypothetical protein
MQTRDVAPVVQPHAAGPGGHADKGAYPMFTKENDVTTSSAQSPRGRRPARKAAPIVRAVRRTSR